jgi:hypothetical protein
MGEWRRGTHGARRLESTPTSVESRVRAAQEKGGNEVLTARRRCSRRRLDEEGGVV